MVLIYIAVLLGGLASLSWEVLWQHYASLSLGVSAYGTAITLVSMMSGMALGSFLAPKVLKFFPSQPAFLLYGVLEGLVGFFGLILPKAFDVSEQLDRIVFQFSPLLSYVSHFFLVFGILLLPSLAMGATIPVLTSISQKYERSLARLYAINITGAFLGILISAFAWIPLYGINLTRILTASINLIICLVVIGSYRKLPKSTARETEKTFAITNLFPLLKQPFVIVATSGWATFVLEISWFRSLRAAFQATTDSFALILASTLLPLSLGALLASFLKKWKKITEAHFLAGAGIFVLLTTPVIERVDEFVPIFGSYFEVMRARFLLAFALMSPTIILIGICLPLVMEKNKEPRKTAWIYGVNTIASALGAIFAAWFFLPTLGFAKTAWFNAGILLLVAFYLFPKTWRYLLPVISFPCFLIAIYFESGVGKRRVQIPWIGQKHHVLESIEGPDSTVSVIENQHNVRELIIDGFSASGEAKGANYMEWMGRLPMLSHSNPSSALVICFGTGQTANGVRLEGAKSLDIVDVNRAVFKLSKHFKTNQNVLEDTRVQQTVMDGRAWLRRTSQTYDVITLEPMPPNFAGSNSLYSYEFYELMKKRLKENGIVAQWLPFHLVGPIDSASIVATFLASFASVILWVDPIDHTGILLGKVQSGQEMQLVQWPGLSRQKITRNIPDQVIRRQSLLQTRQLKKYSLLGTIITDDNQRLSYGYHGRTRKWWLSSDVKRQELNFSVLHKILEAYSSF